MRKYLTRAAIIGFVLGLLTGIALVAYGILGRIGIEGVR